MNFTGANCEKCPLNAHRAKAVEMECPSEGAHIIFVGEAPGVHEAARARPFVGPSGDLLRGKIAIANRNAGFQVAYTNAVACRPPGNDTPSEEAVRCCAGRLEREIQESKAQRVVALGNTALKALGITDSATRADGRWYFRPGRRIIGSVHPAAVLRNMTRAKSFSITIGRAFLSDKHIISTDVPFKLVTCEAELPPVGPKTVIDIETDTHKDQSPRLTDRIRCVSICPDGENVYIVTEAMVYSEAFSDWLIKAFSSARLVGSNLKFDIKYLMSLNGGLLPEALIYDTMLMHYTINEEGLLVAGGDLKDGRSRGHGLKLLMEKLMGVKDYSIKDFHNIPDADLYKYAAKDGYYTWILSEMLEKAVAKNPDSQRLYNTILAPAAIALADVERGGMAFDEEYSRAAAVELQILLGRFRESLRDISGNSEHNPNSWQQNAKVIYEQLKLPYHYSSEGRVTTNATALQDCLEELILAGETDSTRTNFLEGLREFKSLSKTMGTYLVGMMEKSQRGIIYPSYFQHTVVTGRLSSADPNAQNITRAGAVKLHETKLSHEFIQTWFPELIADGYAPNYGIVIRRQFTADPGHVLLQVDYSQAELRVLAWITKDQAMIQSYRDGIDLHDKTAIELFGEKYTGLDVNDKAQKALKKELRNMTKRINFGIAYKITPTSIALQWWAELSMEQKRIRKFKDLVKQAEELFKAWFAARPGVKKWQDEIEALVIRGEGLTTPFGRKRRLSFIPRGGKGLVEAVNHMTNFPVQSSASDCTGLSLTRIHSILRKNGWWPHTARIIATVHDSIVFSCLPEVVPVLRKIVQDVMIKVPREYLGDLVPFEVDFEIGPNWGALKEMK